MNGSTGVFCTIILPDSEKAAAVADYPYYFQVGLSADGKAPATHWVSSGCFDNSEMNVFVTHIVDGWRFDFGNDLPGALAAAGLQMITEEQP